jgi:hypothetical protein
LASELDLRTASSCRKRIEFEQEERPRFLHFSWKSWLRWGSPQSAQFRPASSIRALFQAAEKELTFNEWSDLDFFISLKSSKLFLSSLKVAGHFFIA